MATKKSTRTSKPRVQAPATPKEVIARYDCLQMHVKILTVLSGLILLAVVVLGIVLVNCDDCKTSDNTKSVPSSDVIEVTPEEE